MNSTRPAEVSALMKQLLHLLLRRIAALARAVAALALAVAQHLVQLRRLRGGFPLDGLFCPIVAEIGSSRSGLAALWLIFHNLGLSIYIYGISPISKLQIGAQLQWITMIMTT
jgi:hypothetical protein